MRSSGTQVHSRASGVLRAAAIIAVLGLWTMLLSPLAALADNVVNDVTVGGTDTFTAPGSTTVGYKINTAAADDPQSGCNASDGSPATVTLGIPAGVSASTTSLTFTACNAFQYVTFSSSTPGSYDINVSRISDSGAGSYKNEANFTLQVNGTISDTTPPVLTLPGNITAEATSSAGAAVSFTASATDLVDGPVSVTCAPASGSTFALGSTTVTCSATDAAGNPVNGSFTVTVVDTGAPSITFVGIAPAPDSNGWNNSLPVTLTWNCADTGSGVVADPVTVEVTTEGVQTITGTCTDNAGNTATDDQPVKIDATNPELHDMPANQTIEATGPGGAVATWTEPTATDNIDSNPSVNCDAVPGSTFPLGTTTVTCTAKDNAKNEASASFTITVVDTTGPEVTVPANITAEATSSAGAVVSFTASATDLVEGPVSVTCAPASGSTFALGSTTVTCSATDAAGNPGSDSFTVTVQDTTAPTLSLPSNIVTDPTGISGAVVTFSATANDIVDGAVTVGCTPPSGSTFGFGTTTVNCTATDAAGNTARGSFSVTVKNLTKSGFYQPVDMNGIVNTVKVGSTVPLKFEVFAGTTELTDINVVKSLTYAEVVSTGSTTDEIETLSTGGTSLRYDTTSGQFIYNWSTKGLVKGKTYRVTVTLQDGSAISALFLMK